MQNRRNQPYRHIWILSVLLLSLPVAEVKGKEATPTPDVVLQILDKTTARTQRVHITSHQPLEFGTLRVIVHRCHRSPVYEAPESAVYLEIWEQKSLSPPMLLFEGWMFSSPVVSLEHPIYEVRIISCNQCTSCCKN